MARNTMEREFSCANSFVIDDSDGFIIDKSEDHSTNIGTHAVAKTKNIGFNAGATNIGPGAGGINSNHGPGAGGVNSGPGAGSINADNINGGVQFGYHNPIPIQNQYSPQPTRFPDNQIGSMNYMLHNDPIPYDPETWFNHNPDFDHHSYYHLNSTSGAGYQNSYYHHNSTAGSENQDDESADEGEDVVDYNSETITPIATNKEVKVGQMGNTIVLWFNE